MTRRRSSNSTCAPWPMPCKTSISGYAGREVCGSKAVVWTRFVAVIGGVGYRGGNIYHPHWRCILHQRTGRLGGLNKVFLERVNNLLFHFSPHGPSAVYVFHCTNLRELTREGFRRRFAPRGGTP